MFSAPQSHEIQQQAEKRTWYLFVCCCCSLLELQLHNFKKNSSIRSSFGLGRIFTFHTKKRLLEMNFGKQKTKKKKKLCPQLHEWLNDFMRKAVDCRQILFLLHLWLGALRRIWCGLSDIFFFLLLFCPQRFCAHSRKKSEAVALCRRILCE